MYTKKSEVGFNTFEAYFTFFHFCSGLTSIYVLTFALLFSLKTLAFLLNVNDGFLKLIIVGDRYHSGYNEEGILMMSLYDFLLGKGG